MATKPRVRGQKALVAGPLRKKLFFAASLSQAEIPITTYLGKTPKKGRGVLHPPSSIIKKKSYATNYTYK